MASPEALTCNSYETAVPYHISLKDDALIEMFRLVVELLDEVGRVELFTSGVFDHGVP